MGPVKIFLELSFHLGLAGGNAYGRLKNFKNV